MFADDIVLLAPPMQEIQSMLDACESELKLLDLKVSASKSMCIRIGNRYKAHCCQLLSSCGIVPWVNEARYLGMHIASNHKFIVDLSKAKAKFYRSANAILGKLGNQKNPAVSLQLMQSIALPVLLYGLEALSFCKSDKVSLDHTWDRSFMKVYMTFNKEIIQQCQYYGGFLPVSLLLDIRKTDFLSRLHFSENNLLIFLYNNFGYKDLCTTAKKYNVQTDFFIKNSKFVVKNYFTHQIFA